MAHASPQAGSGPLTGIAGACGNGVREGAELCDGADCPTECTATTNACVGAKLEGSAATCDEHCVPTEITVCTAGDKCCPMGCNHGTDADCSPSCGDGVLTGSETCEPASKDHPCATQSACDDGDPCTEDKLLGSAAQCSAACAHMPVTQSRHGDQCCPAGSNIGTDDDCAPSCGDGVVSDGEACDPAAAGAGACPTEASCDRDISTGCTRGVLAGSATNCSAHCMPEVIRATIGDDGCCPERANAANDNDCSPYCGDGAVTQGEICDPGIPQGQQGACPSMSNCSLVPGNPCEKAALLGDAQRCTAECGIAPREAGPRDQCCPPGATSASDPDCAPSCGDGRVEDEETCDNGPGSPRRCPTSADCGPKGAGCAEPKLVGNACTARCERVEITQPRSGDICCPPGANPGNDSDCKAPSKNLYDMCTWPASSAPDYNPNLGTAPPSASQPYGCDGRYSVCAYENCNPTCKIGDTTDPEGRPGICENGRPPVFSPFCKVDADCPHHNMACVSLPSSGQPICRFR